MLAELNIVLQGDVVRPPQLVTRTERTKERYTRGRHLRQRIPIGAPVLVRVHKTVTFVQLRDVTLADLLPGPLEPTACRVVETRDDRKHAREVIQPAATLTHALISVRCDCERKKRGYLGNSDEVLRGSCSPLRVTIR